MHKWWYISFFKSWGRGKTWRDHVKEHAHIFNPRIRMLVNVCVCACACFECFSISVFFPFSSPLPLNCSLLVYFIQATGLTPCPESRSLLHWKVANLGEYIRSDGLTWPDMHGSLVIISESIVGKRHLMKKKERL